MGSTTGSIIINVKGKEVTVGVNAPINPKDNELWLDTNDGQNVLKYYSSKDKKWHNVNDMSGEFSKIYTELKTNYYTKTESDDSVKTIIGETTITKSDGKEVNMKDAINSVIDTANSHTTQIGNIETKFSDYSTIEDVNSKITKAQQTSEDYTIEAIKNLNIGAANLINGSTIYTEDNKLSITATKNAYSQQIDKISVDLKENEIYTVNCQADAAWGTENISAELMCTNEEIISGVRLFTLYTNYQYSQTNIDKYSANGYTGKWFCRPVGNLKANDIAKILVYNTTTKTNNYILTKVIKIESDNRTVTTTSLGVCMTTSNTPLLISGYSYNQTGIDKYSAADYSGAWIVSSVEGIAINDIVSIRLRNSTTNEYNYIYAKVTKINSDTKKITATSIGVCIVSSAGGIVCKSNDTVSLKCRASGGASELRYKYEGKIVSTGETITLQDWSDNNSFEYLVNSDFTDKLDITVSIKDRGGNVVTSNSIRLFVNATDDGSGYQYPSTITVVDTIKAWLVCDDLTKTIYPMPYTFKCTKTGKYILWLGVNQDEKTHMFWNFKLERGNKATDWSINPVEEQATLKVSSDKINAVVSSLDSEGSITLTDKMAEVVADTISLNGNVKVNGDMIVNGAITVDKIATNSITADKLAISTSGFVKDPMFTNWNDLLPDGFMDWNSSFANGKVNKVVENNANLIEMIAVTNGEFVGLASNGSSTSTTSLFSYKLSLDGLKYICVEIKFRLTDGVNPSGAGFALDICGYNTSNTLVNKKIICKLSDLGTDLINNTWYTYRKIEKLDDEMSACKLDSLSAFLLCNYSELGTLTAKTIQFASLNVYRATEQDYLTQSWTSGTYINGNALLTGSVTADSIATDAIKSKNYAEFSDTESSDTEFSDTSMPYSKEGTYLNLSDGAIISPTFAVDPVAKKTYAKNISIDGGEITIYGDPTITDKYIRMTSQNFDYGDGITIPTPVIVLTNPLSTHSWNNSYIYGDHIEIPEIIITKASFITSFAEGSYDNSIFIDVTSNTTIRKNGGTFELATISNANSIKYGVDIDSESFRPCGDGDQVITDSYNTKCAPLNLGSGKHSWSNVFTKHGVIKTSDRNEKHDIEDLSNTLATSFILGIQPKSYKYNDGKSGRTHYGMISQDIEELLDSLGMSSLDFAGFIKSPKMEEYIENVTNENGETVLKPDGTPLTEIKTKKIDGEYSYALRYEEFIAPLIKFVQIQNERIDKLENDVLELKNKNTELENKYNDLLSRVEKLENTEGSN